MTTPKKGFSVQEAVALAAGVLVVVVAALVTTWLRPILFPFNFAASLGLGAAAYLGTLKILDPRTPRDLIDDQAAAEFRSLLSEMRAIAARISAARLLSDLSQLTADRLLAIASVVEALAGRYQAGSAGFAGASATLTVLRQFDRVLAYYLRIKSGQQYLAPEARAREMAQTEERTIPLVRDALENLARQLDAGEVVDKNVSEDTLQSVLRSLNLVDTLADDADASLADKEGLQ
jgi:hypothetical protein